MLKRVNIALPFCLEGVTELKWQEMSSSMLIPHTNAHAIRSRPTLKDIERFRNGLVYKVKEKEGYSTIPNGQIDILWTKQNGKQLLYFRTSY